MLFSPCHAIYKQHGVTRLTYTYPLYFYDSPCTTSTISIPTCCGDRYWCGMNETLPISDTMHRFDILLVHQELAMQQTSSIGCFETIKQTQKKVYRNIIHLCARRVVVACFYYRIQNLLLVEFWALKICVQYFQNDGFHPKMKAMEKRIGSLKAISGASLIGASYHKGKND